MEWWNGLFTKWYNIPWRIHGAAIYGAPWIPSIYPSHVSIFLPAPWIRHGHYSIAKAMWVMPDPGRISSMSTPSWGLGLPGLPIIQVRRWLSIESQSDLGYPHFWKKTDVSWILLPDSKHWGAHLQRKTCQSRRVSAISGTWLSILARHIHWNLNITPSNYIYISPANPIYTNLSYCSYKPT